MIKAIIFDYGGVFGSSVNWQDFVRQTHQDNPDLREELIESIMQEWLKARVGENPDQFWLLLSKALRADIDTTKQRLIEAGGPEASMKELVQKLKPDYKLAILSNHVKDWLDPIVKKYHLDELFDEIVTSYQEKIAKPDLEIYQRTLAKLEVKANEAVFIDDMQENVTAAKQLGMVGISYSGFEELEQKLNLVS